MSYASDASELAGAKPPCQINRPHLHLTATCEPGCVHEQLLVARAQVSALLGICKRLDTIGAQLADISSRQ